jgi:hypothetical protein
MDCKAALPQLFGNLALRQTLKAADLIPDRTRLPAASPLDEFHQGIAKVVALSTQARFIVDGGLLTGIAAANIESANGRFAFGHQWT